MAAVVNNSGAQTQPLPELKRTTAGPGSPPSQGFRSAADEVAGEVPFVSHVVLPQTEETPDIPREPEYDLDPQAYDDELNAVVATMVDSVTEEPDRKLHGLKSGGNAEHYKALIEHKLHEQAANGENVSLEKAYQQVEDDIRGRYGAAADAYDDKDHRLSVLNGYWERQAGHDDAKDLSVEAYQHYWNTYGPAPDEGSYDDKLNTLAGGLVGGVIEEHRYLAIALGDGDDKAGQLYKNLIKDKLDEQGPPLNLERAKREVNEDLLDRVGNAAANTDVDAGDLVNVFEGYWERHAGEETAGELADKAYREFALDFTVEDGQITIDPDSDYEDDLNAVVATMARDVDTDRDRIRPFSDKAIRDHYADMVYAKLQEQKDAGEPPNLDAAYDAVKDDVYGRLPHALRDHEDAGDAQQMYEDYWDNGGKTDASRVAREAYTQFLADDTATDNPDYDDNLNALAAGLTGSVIDDTTKFSPLSDPTLGTLYKNMVKHELDNGLELGEAANKVLKDLEGRIGSTLEGDDAREGKIEIIKNYLAGEGTTAEAKTLAERAQAEYDQAHYDSLQFDPDYSSATGQVSIDPDSDYDDALNGAAAAIAEGVDTDSGRILPITDESIRDHYADLLYSKLMEAHEAGEPINLDAAFEAVREDVFGRLPNALRDDENADDAQILYEKYWDAGGNRDASNVARIAYSQFLADTTETNATDYADNLDALSAGLVGSVIDSTTRYSLLSDRTLGVLFQNMVRDELVNGAQTEDAIDTVLADLDEHVGTVLDDDPARDRKIEIIRSYLNGESVKREAALLVRGLQARPTSV